MEVPWWPIVSVLFILWNDANICSKAEASHLVQSSKLHQNIETEGEQIASQSVINFGTNNGVTKPTNPQQLISQQSVLQQTFPFANAQDKFRPQLTSKISQQQSTIVQENVLPKQKQPIVSSTCAPANQQRSVASNMPPQSKRLVFPVVTANCQPVQENIVQQKSSVTSSSAAIQPANHFVPKIISQQQSKVSSIKNADQNCMTSELVTPSTQNRGSFQENIPQQRFSTQSIPNILKSKCPGSFVQPVSFVKPNPFCYAIYETPQQNQLKQESSTSSISSSNSEGEALASSSVKQSSTINSQSESYSPQLASSQKVTQQSNIMLSSDSQNFRTPVTTKIPSAAIQPLIRGNTLHRPSLVTSIVTPETTAQSISNTKSLGSSICYGPISHQDLANMPQQNSGTQEYTNKQSSVISIKPSNSIGGPQEFFGFPVTSKSPNPVCFPPSALLPGTCSFCYPTPWPQGLIYQQDFTTPELTKIPPVDLTSSAIASQIDISKPFSNLYPSNTQQMINPQYNQISNDINSVSSNSLAPSVNARQIVTKTEQQAPNPVASNGILIPAMSPHTVVSNNVELTSNIQTTSPEISLISGVQSRSVAGSFPSSNFLNSNVGSIQTISSQVNSVGSDILSTGNAASSVTSNLRSPIAVTTPFSCNVAPTWLGNVPVNAYSYSNVMEQPSESPQFPVISQSARLSSFPCVQPVWVSYVNPFLTNSPVSNFNTNCVDEPSTTYFSPNQQSTLNTVSQINQNIAVNNIASEGKNPDGVSISTESEIIQTNAQSDISSPDAPINTVQFISEIKDFVVHEKSLVPVVKEVNIQSTVEATQEISSGLLKTEPDSSVSSTVSTIQETVVDSSDGGVSRASINSYINNTPTGLASPTITFVAPVPSIPTSVTPLCSITPTPSVCPSFRYPLFQPIIMEESNSKTNNWLPVILAAFIRDNGCSGYNGGNCNGLCNRGTQYGRASYYTPTNNKLKSSCSRRGSTSNCGIRGQSKPSIIIEVDSESTESADSSEQESDETTDPSASKEISGGEQEKS